MEKSKQEPLLKNPLQIVFRLSSLKKIWKLTLLENSDSFAYVCNYYKHLHVVGLDPFPIVPCSVFYNSTD